MNTKHLALAVLLFFLIPAVPGHGGVSPSWSADSRTGFRILVPGGWTVRRHLSEELALRARSRDGAASIEVHIIRETFSTKGEAAAGFENREALRSLSPVEIWRGTIITVGGERGILRRYRAVNNGRPAEVSAACFGRDGTWYCVLAAVSSGGTDIRAADLERSLRSFSLPETPPVSGDPIEGRWRWNNGAIVAFAAGGRIFPSFPAVSWRRKPPSIKGEAPVYLIFLSGPGGGEKEAVLGTGGKKLFLVSGKQRIQAAARIE